MSSQAQEFIRKTVILCWVVFEIYVLVTAGWWIALGMSVFISLLVLGFYFIKDAFLGVHNWANRPNVVIFMEDDNHDPTKPDDPEHPLIVMGDRHYRRVK